MEETRHGIKIIKSKDEYFDYVERATPLRLFKKKALDTFLREEEDKALSEHSVSAGPFRLFKKRIDRHVSCESRRKTLPGYSVPAGRMVDFLLDVALCMPDGSINLRETVNCPETYFNMRMRAGIQVLLSFEMERSVPAYVMEQKTPLYRYFKDIFPALTGSEFLGDKIPLGQMDKDGIRNEDATNLTFESETFDFVMSFDVLEHIPNYISAFREVFRVLRNGGRFYFTAPFAVTCQDHLVRARVQDGEIVHILEPEWHGDPVTGEGILCFHHFGWAVLDELRECGFSRAEVLVLDAVEYGYYVDEPILVFMAVK